VYFKVERDSEYAWRYGGEHAMVIVPVYISSLSPSLISVWYAEVHVFDFLSGRTQTMV